MICLTINLKNMPSAQQIVNLSRALSYTDSVQYTDLMAIEDFNSVYHDLENDLVRYLNEDYYYDVQFADLIANQTEYILPLSTSGISGFKKITDLGIKYVNDGYNVYSYDVPTKSVVLTVSYPSLSLGQTVTFVTKDWYLIGTDTVATIPVAGLEFTLTTGIAVLTAAHMLQIKTWVEYVKGKNVSTASMNLDENTYRNDQPVQMPMYKISDNSIWLYPVATEYVANGMKIYTIRDQIDLTISSTESDIRLPRQYQNIIAHGMVPRIYQRRGMINEKNDSEVAYDNKKDEMMKELSNRNVSPLEASLPPLKYLS